MHFIHTNNFEEQRQLEDQFSTKNGYYMVPHKHSYFIVEMLSAITYEYFQNKVPVIVDKFKQIIVNALSGTYSLAAYRQIMRLAKKEDDTMQIYRSHLIEMNRAFAEDELQLDVEERAKDIQDQDQIFQEALKGQTHKYSNLEQLFELPVMSELQIPRESSDTNTQKTVKTDLEWSRLAFKDSHKINGMGTAKLQNFFAANESYSLQSWKTNRKEETRQQTSRQMSSFSKKRSRIIDTNKDLDEIVATQVKYDLNRQISLASGIVQQLRQEQKLKNYQRKIKNTILNNKLKHRRK